MKQISQEQINSLLALLERYNVGVKDYVLAQKLFSELPLVEVKEK